MLANIKKRALAMLLTICMIAGVMPTAAFAAEGPYADRVVHNGTVKQYDKDGNAASSNADAAVTIQKTIEATNVENEFDITLNVKSKDIITQTDKKVGADIVLVFDASTSMDENGNPTRWKKLKDAADSFVDKMLGEGTNNKISIVIYGGSNGVTRYTNHKMIQEWSNDAGAVKASYNYSKVMGEGGLRNKYFADAGTAYGATNCQAGFMGAEEMLKSARAEALKYVVYMSDGDANREYTYDSCEKTEHVHSDACNTFVCGKAAHEHDGDCSKLVCGKDAHNHSDACNKLVCVKAEHNHSNCGKTGKDWDHWSIWGHDCDDSCYTCNKAAHEHDGDCSKQVCGKDAHNHEKKCSKLVCGTDEHKHEKKCSKRGCDIDEHKHYDCKVIYATEYAGIDENGMMYAANGMPILASIRSNYSVTAAKAQAAHIKAKYPDTKIITVGFDTDSNNKVLRPAKGEGAIADGNAAVDEFHNGTTSNIDSIYDTISDIITNAIDPWVVYDPMSDAVDLVADSILDDAHASADMDGRRIVWNLAEIVKENPKQKDFTLTYTVKLKENKSIWEGQVPQATNDKTELVFKVDNTTNAVKVQFDVPRVIAPLYTVTLEHWIDGKLAGSSTEEITNIGGHAIDLVSKQISRPYTQFIGRSIDGTNMSEVAYVLSETNTAKTIRFDYQTGVPLTINYIDAETKLPISDKCTRVIKSNTEYSEKSPEVLGYTIADVAQNVVSGTMGTNEVVVDVAYNRDSYTVTYTFSGDYPSSAVPPVDSRTYHYGDKLDVAEALDAPHGWAFTGWNTEDGYEIVGNTTVEGSFQRESYTLDVIYKFASETDRELYNNRCEAAVSEAVEDANEAANAEHTSAEAPHEGELADCEQCQARISNAAAAAAAKYAIIGEFKSEYTAADGEVYTNVYLKETIIKSYQGSYEVAAVSVPGFAVNPAKNAGALTQNSAVFFVISNDLFSVTVEHKKETKSGTYETFETDSAALANGETYTVVGKSLEGFGLVDMDKLGAVTVDGSNIVVELRYDALKYDASFIFEGETPDGVQAPGAQADIWYGDKVTAPNVGKVNGWTFEGWYTKNTDGELVKYDFNTSVKGNIELIGNWTRNTYKVEFVFTPAANVPSTAVLPEAQTGIKYEAKAAAPAAIDAGEFNTDAVSYSFDGWYTSATGGERFSFDTAITSNVKLYGRWTTAKQQYAFRVEHINADTNAVMLTSEYDDKMDFGTAISNEMAGSYKLGTAELGKLLQYADFARAEGVTISQNAEDNVIKCYYKTREHKLTINYVYQNNEPVVGLTPAVLTYSAGAPYSENTPNVPNYTKDLSVVEGTMPDSDITKTVVYTEKAKYEPVINYYLEGTSTPVAQSATMPAVHVGNEYSLNEENTSGKEITNHTYARTEGALSGTMTDAGVTINVYFTRNAGTVTVKYVDESGSDIAQSVGGKIDTATDVGYAPLTADKIPAGYKFGSRKSATTDANGAAINDAVIFADNNNATVNLKAKGDSAVITYTYVKKQASMVNISYVLVDAEGKTLRTLGTDVMSFEDAASYDATSKILPVYGVNGEFEHISTEGNVKGSLAAGETAEITLKYVATEYAYAVKFVDASTGEQIGELLENEKFTASFGTVINDDLVSTAYGNLDWRELNRPSGYRVSAITYPTMAKDNNIVVVSFSRTYSPPVTPDPDPEDPKEPVIDVDEPEIPLGPGPEIEIDEPEVPMGELPETDGGDVVIIDPEVPLGNLPNTGILTDNRKNNTAVITLVISTIAGTAYVVSRKKDDEVTD